MAQDLCARLREKKLISIVRGAPTEKITKIADAIYRGGFRFMEITFDQSGKTPYAVTAEQIRIVREAFDGRLHAVVRNLLDSHKLLRRLPTLIFLLFFHVGSSHSKSCCSVR